MEHDPPCPENRKEDVKACPVWQGKLPNCQRTYTGPRTPWGERASGDPSEGPLAIAIPTGKKVALL
jgi:hypothetical protein